MRVSTLLVTAQNVRDGEASPVFGCPRSLRVFGPLGTALFAALLRWRMTVGRRGCRHEKTSPKHTTAGAGGLVVGVCGVPVPAGGDHVAVRWYLRFGLSYRDLEELLVERGVDVDHVTLFRWVQHFTPILIDATRPCRYGVSDRWFVDETYVKVPGVWRDVYRAVDHYGQVIDVFVSKRRDTTAARHFFTGAIRDHGQPFEVVTDRSAALAKTHHRTRTRRAP